MFRGPAPHFELRGTSYDYRKIEDLIKQIKEKHPDAEINVRIEIEKIEELTPSMPE